MTTTQNPPGPKVLSLLKAAVPVQNANDLARELRALALKVEARNSGYLSECPNPECREANKGDSLCFSFANIGSHVVAFCYAGCDDSEGLLKYGDLVKLKREWLDLLRSAYTSSEDMFTALELLPRPKEPEKYPQAIHTRDFLALKVPPRVELCGPWLREQTITEVYGWRGAGKSWFSLHLAYCVSAGVDFMKWPVKKAKRVVYVDGEMGLDEMQDRLRLIIESEEKKAGRALDFDLYHLSDSNLVQFPDGLPKLSTPEGRALIEAQLIHGPTLLILDNLSTLFNSAIENDAESWCEAQDWLISLRRRGHSIVFIHHAGKGGMQRGTSKREDACNNVIALKQPEDHQAEDGAAFTLKFEKSRGVHGPSVSSFEAKLTQDEHGSLVWALAAKEPSKAEQIEALLSSGISAYEISKQGGFTKSQVYKVASSFSAKQPTGVSSPQSYKGGSPQSSPPKGGERGLSDYAQRQPKEDQRTSRGPTEDQSREKPHQQRESSQETRGPSRGLAEDQGEDQQRTNRSYDVSIKQSSEDQGKDQRTKERTRGPTEDQSRGTHQEAPEEIGALVGVVVERDKEGRPVYVL